MNLIYIIRKNCSKYRFKCLLTKDPSKTSSLEYTIKTNYTVLLLLYGHIFLCVNGLTHFNWVMNESYLRKYSIYSF